MKKAQSLWGKLFSGSGWAIFTMFIWELVEEMLEGLIAVAITNATAIFITKALSTLAIITATQAVKAALKGALLPIIRKITYREGNDKMNKVKKFFSWLWANKCTIGGVTVGAVTVVSGAGLIDVSSFPALMAGAVNLTPVLYYGILGVLTILMSFFPESVEKFAERISTAKTEKEQKAIEKQAQKELKAEQKLANQTQAQKEKEDAKKLAKEKADAQKAEAEAQYRAKVDEAKAKLKAE